MSNQKTSKNTDNATSLPESEGGRLRFGWRDGRKIGESGLDHAPVSRFRALGSEKAMPINDTCGPLFIASSPSTALQLSLESRLRARMDVNGSLEYALTWSTWDMPAGVSICRLRASARRTSGSGFGGWPTPRAQEPGKTNEGYGKSVGMVAKLAGWPTPMADDSGTQRDLKHRIRTKRQLTLDDLSRMVTGWVSPTAQDGSRGSLPARPHDTGVPLSQQAALAGWSTPTQRDHKDGASDLSNTPINSLLGRQVSLSPAPTKKRAALNPAFPRWLMGFPVAFGTSAQHSGDWLLWQALMAPVSAEQRAIGLGLYEATETPSSHK